MGTVVSLSFAFVSALSYGIGSVMQATAARRVESRPNLDPMLIIRLIHQVPYVVGIALDLVGFAASVVALRKLPLFMVQSTIAGSVGVTAIAASIAFGTRLRRSERGALIGLLVGLVLLAMSALPEQATELSRGGRWCLVAGAVAVALVGSLGARLDRPAQGVVLALSAGLSWAGTGIAARVLHVPSPLWRLILDPAVLALVAYGLLGALFFASALQHGSVTAAAALVFSVETVIPSVVGLIFLGDHARPHFAFAAALGVTITVISSIALARYSEPMAGETATAE